MQPNDAKVLLWGMWVAVFIAGEVFHVQDPMAWLSPVVHLLTMVKGELGGEAESGIFEEIFGDSGVKKTAAETKKSK